MTPEEAQHATRDAEYIGANLPGECWRALDTIANMRAEYRTEYQAAGGRWLPVPHYCSCGGEWGNKQRAELDAAYWKDDGYATRIIRHYVTKPEEIK